MTEHEKDDCEEDDWEELLELFVADRLELELFVWLTLEEDLVTETDWLDLVAEIEDEDFVILTEIDEDDFV